MTKELNGKYLQEVSIEDYLPVDVIEVVPPLEAAAYSAGDVLSDTVEIPGVFRVAGGKSGLVTFIVNDEDDQGVPLYLVFLRSNVALGTKNSAPNISDVNAREIVGIVPVVAADYVDLGGVKIAMITSKPFEAKGAATSTSLYLALLLGATGGTFTASGIRVKIGVTQD